jgi:hypothetical protein
MAQLSSINLFNVRSPQHFSHSAESVCDLKSCHVFSPRSVIPGRKPVNGTIGARRAKRWMACIKNF